MSQMYSYSEPGIPVYAPPYTGSPKLVLNAAGYSPNDVAVSRQGVVGVTNYCKLPSCANNTGSVAFYAHNSTTPCATVTDPNFLYMLWDAFDGKGNLYINGQDSSGNTLVGEITGGCKAKKVRILTASPSTTSYPHSAFKWISAAGSSCLLSMAV